MVLYLWAFVFGLQLFFMTVCAPLQDLISLSSRDSGLLFFRLSQSQDHDQDQDQYPTFCSTSRRPWCCACRASCSACSCPS